jgi:hypothetical protein
LARGFTSMALFLNAASLYQAGSPRKARRRPGDFQHTTIAFDVQYYEK